MSNIYDWGTLIVERRRTVDYQFAIYESDGATGIALSTADVVRFKVATHGNKLVLDLDSVAASSNGSSITVDNTTAPARGTVRFAEGDTAAMPNPTYHGELSFVDDSDGDIIKTLATGRIQVLGSAN